MSYEISPERQRLEELIIQTSDDVDNAKPDGTWIYDTEYYAFQKAWGQLVSYYASHADDTQISVEVMREYLVFTRMLRHAMLDDRLTKERQEQASDALISLEGALNEIITEIVTYRNWKERN